MWPNVVRLAVAHLTAQTAPALVTTRVPPGDSLVADVEAGGVVRVARGPGTDDGVTDAPLVDVETFTSSKRRGAVAPEDAMWDLAEKVRQEMHALAGRNVAGSLVDNVTTAAGPVEVDYGNPAVRRMVASYRFELRQQPSA